MEQVPKTARNLLQSVTMDTINGVHRFTLDRLKKVDDLSTLNDYINHRNNELFGHSAQHAPQSFEFNEAVTHYNNIMNWLDDKEEVTDTEESPDTAKAEEQALGFVKDVQASFLENLAERPNDFGGGMSVGLYGLEQVAEEGLVPDNLSVDFKVTNERVAQLRNAHKTLQKEASAQGVDVAAYTAERLREAAEDLFPDTKVLFDSSPGLKYWVTGVAEAILLTVDRQS